METNNTGNEVYGGQSNTNTEVTTEPKNETPNTETTTDAPNSEIVTEGGNQEDAGGAKEGETPEEGAPEVYSDFALPEGVTYSNEDVERFKGIAKDLNLTQAGAQKIVDLIAENTQSVNEAHTNGWAKVREGWVSDLKTDKEYGGKNFNETVERANRALGKYGSEGLTEFLKYSGFGDNGELVKMLAKFDKMTGEGQFTDGKTSDTVSEKSAAEILYPNS